MKNLIRWLTQPYLMGFLVIVFLLPNSECNQKNGTNCVKEELKPSRSMT